jgi:DNA-binding CsgD family transcriptional regulator
VNGTLFYSSFYRSAEEREFQPDDIDTVQLLSYFAIRALQRHVELRTETSDLYSPAALPHNGDGPFAQKRAAFVHMREVFLADCAKLSPREADISAAIVLGYAALAISLNLGITLNTVATHRKRAYRRLGISSQTELFGQYFKNIAKHPERRHSPIAFGIA